MSELPIAIILLVLAVMLIAGIAWIVKPWKDEE